MAERRIRSKEERAAEIDQKIISIKEEIVALNERRETVLAEFDRKEKDKKDRIKALENKKEEILNPKPKTLRRTRKQKMKELFDIVYKSGMSAEVAAEMLGLSESEDAEVDEETEDTNE